MADRYYNPVTGIIEYTEEPSYARAVGLVPWPEGFPTYKIDPVSEVDFADLDAEADRERAELSELHKDELTGLAGERGLDTSGTNAELVDRLVESGVAGDAVIASSGASSAPKKAPAPAVGGKNNTTQEG